MMTKTPAPHSANADDRATESQQNNAETGHKLSRPTILKDREEALRANLLKRKQQQQTRKDASTAS